jgi:hypothetical protein
MIFVTLLTLGDALYRTDKKMIADMKCYVRMTSLLSPAWSVTWHETRLRRYQQISYQPYPELPSADRLGFIYARRAW